MKTPLSPKRAKGFTLIELMVAMAITTVIVTVLVSITGIAIDTWQRGRAEIRASRQAKSMLDTMAKDFESLVSRRGNNFEWLYSKVEADLPGPSANMSSNAAEVIFFTAATDRYEGQIGTDLDLGGDVSCVSYQLQYQDPVKGKEEENSSSGPGVSQFPGLLATQNATRICGCLGKCGWQGCGGKRGWMPISAKRDWPPGRGSIKRLPIAGG